MIYQRDKFNHNYETSAEYIGELHELTILANCGDHPTGKNRRSRSRLSNIDKNIDKNI